MTIAEGGWECSLPEKPTGPNWTPAVLTQLVPGTDGPAPCSAPGIFLGGAGETITSAGNRLVHSEFHTGHKPPEPDLPKPTCVGTGDPHQDTSADPRRTARTNRASIISRLAPTPTCRPTWKFNVEQGTTLNILKPKDSVFSYSLVNWLHPVLLLIIHHFAAMFCTNVSSKCQDRSLLHSQKRVRKLLFEPFFFFS